MERLPLEHIRVHDGPQPVTPRPVSSGSLIYCNSDSFVVPTGDGLSAYTDMTAALSTGDVAGLTIPLSSSSTIYMHCQFNFSYQTPTIDHVQCRAWCDLDGAPGFTLASPISTDRRLTPASADDSMMTLVSLGWTCVVTRSDSITISPHGQINADGTPNTVDGSYFLSVIIGPDTGADCVTWQTIG